METDNLFYRLFSVTPNLIHELAGTDPNVAYRFDASVLKSLERRPDGVLRPATDDPTQPIVFLEAQMQPERQLYRRTLTKIALYLDQNDLTNPWKTIAIYPSRATERLEQEQMRQALNLTTIYLDELPESGSAARACLRLIGTEPEAVPEQARAVAAQTKSEGVQTRELIELISIIVTRKLPELTEQEIEEMLELTPLEKTKPYQEGRQEGLQEGLQEGRQEERREIARNLLRDRMPLEKVAQLTGLTLDEVQQLQLQRLLSAAPRK